ncbi:hypothetical protein LCGC14_1912060, partial [marine sediment metagenome]
MPPPDRAARTPSDGVGARSQHRRLLGLLGALVLAVQDLKTSKQWTQLPQEMRTRIERGLKG